MADNNPFAKHVMQFDPDKVPKPFQSLIPLAQRWSILDEVYLEDAVNEASLEDVHQLVEEIINFPGTLFDEWLSKPDQNNNTYSREWVALTRLVDACDYARLRLKREASTRDKDD